MTMTLYGQSYLPMVPVLMILFASASLGRIGTSFSSVFYSTGKVGVLTKITVIWAGLNIALDFILIPRYGAIGAAIANSATQITALIPGPIMIYRYYKFVMPYRSLMKIIANVFTMGLVTYLLRDHAAGVIPLLLVVLVGGTAYIAGAFVWRVIEAHDIKILRDLAERLKPGWREKCNAVIDTIERVVVK
jgi:O-antigen/teichoic acid export membrane protein